MTNKWMLGTAMAAVIAASPALAQTDMTEFGECKLEEMQNETFLGLDLNDDSGLTQEEYRECLSEAGIELDEEGMAAYDGVFTEADADSDGILVFAEVESYAAESQSADAAPTGTITVTQPAADVVVKQPSADVTVTAPEPQVAVSTPEPDVSVTTPEPKVAVTQPEPTVSVEQPDPTVLVEQPAAEVAVTQGQPQVEVEAGQPAVSVEAVEPQVAVSQPEPEVTVTQPELNVEVEQEEPRVAVEQTDADVSVREVTEAEPAVEEAEIATAAAQTAEAVEAEAIAYEVAYDSIVGEDVRNSAGEDIGEVDEILLDPATNKPILIVSTGGFLGIGDKEVAFVYDDVTITEEGVMLNTPMTKDQIEEMPDIDLEIYEPLPDTMRVE